MRRACAAWFCLWVGAAGAADYRAGPDDYRKYLNRLAPGDRLLLSPGDYRHGLTLHALAGTPDRPVVIEALIPGRRPRFLARPHAHTASLVDVRHLVLRGLEFDGRNLQVDAIRAEGHARHADFVTLESLYIHDHAASQQNVGISTKCPAFGWQVRHNRLERLGTGMYFGNADGSDPFVAGVIEANETRSTLGYNLQIKHQAHRTGATPEGRYDTVIRGNVFSKHDALPGALARPNVLLGHWPRTGEGSADRYLVYGNRFLHNPSEALLQAEGRVAIYDNVFVNGGGDAIHIQAHNDVPREVDVFSNTLLAAGTGIRIRPAPGLSYRQRAIANVVSARRAIEGGEQSHNLVLGYRADLLDVPVAQLTTRLLDSAGVPPRLPSLLVEELMVHAGWAPRVLPGAMPLSTVIPVDGSAR